MKSNSTTTLPGLSSHSSSTKNLCDKCGGSYATLAALISHKKSCGIVKEKGAPSRKRLSIEHRRIKNELLKKQLITAESDSDNVDDDNVAEDEPERHLHAANSHSHSGEHNLRLMNDAIEGSMASNSAAQWPVDFFPSAPFAGPSSEQMGTFLESLGPLFAQANAERTDNASPTTEEQHQQALFTQQFNMLQLLHMFQQLHGSQIPPFPLLAAVTAAATAHQQPSQVASGADNSTPNGNDVTNQKSGSKEGQNLVDKSRNTHPSAALPSVGDSSKVDNQQEEKEDEGKEGARSPSSAGPTQAPTSTRMLLSSLLDLKDTNPDAPLPPSMSPPKDDCSEAAPFNEPNTLELLQKHTEQALQNTMSGGSFLMNGSTENGDLLNFRKGKDGKEDPTSRHRCRYCGKVFGSDSALQIHIRSHTGERPFKCNVCGNRFTTKGNLKVHFQRHKQKYPHVKMNPHPVPEHLDKFHPPLEPPSNSQSPPPAPPGFFPPSSSTFSNNFHIPAIFSSTLIPFGSNDTAKSENDKSIDDKSKSKARSFFDFSEIYRNKTDSTDNRDSRSVHSDCSNDSDDDESESGKAINEREDDSEESDTDLESFDGAINLRKRKRELDEEMDLSFPDDKERSGLSENTARELLAGRMPEENSNSRVDIDSNEEISDDDDLTQYGSSPGALPPSLGLMRFPFGMDFSSIPGSASMPGSLGAGHISGQSVAPSESDSELGDSASKDPIFYQNLLPKPGSTDSTWETLMEVQKASETVKLQQLVDNIEHKLKDPNQCFFCKRVLSCKSALQMHYRTHTGERPFKCKICGRAFTTKGNLKTHMGVHRVKPPLRMMHQCPICHKQFTNALVLQQHIRTHAGEHGDIGSDFLAEFKNSPLMPANFPRSLMPPNFAPFPFPPSMGGSFFPPSLLPEIAAQQFAKSTSFAPLSIPLPSMQPHEVEKEKSKAIEEQASDLTTNKDKDKKSKVSVKIEPENEIIRSSTPNLQLEDEDEEEDQDLDEETSDYKHSLETTPSKAEKFEDILGASLHNGKLKSGEGDSISTLSALENHVKKSLSQVSPQSKGLFASHSADKANALDLTPKSTTSDSSARSPSVESASFPPTSPYAGLQFHGAGRPNTTCRICCKTFACYSALEIHIRSHTKERPFKCEVCDRGFSTKGNMKQHMLTHKIRDLPPDLYTTVSPQSNLSLGNFLTSNNITKILRRTSANSSNNSDSSSVASPQTPNGNNSNSVDSDKIRNTESPAGDQSSSSSRTSGSNKHMCRICNKPFSSGSALQIHMRTHTGDKPFKCSICGRAFTTKGNLKVHMGTHMWSSGNVSRRGRRMSIELPSLPTHSHTLHISPPTMQPSPSQPQHEPGRPDLFFPYLSPHLSGLGPEASQLAMQQMMLMKMMSTNQSAHKLASLAHGSSDKLRPASSNGDTDEVEDNVSANEAESDHQPKESLSESDAPDFTKERNDRNNCFDSKATDEEERLSSHSEHSNPEQKWPSNSKEWKMSCNVCSYTSLSPTDFDQHIKAHLQAAVSEPTTITTTATTTPLEDQSASNHVAKTAGILS